MVNMYAAAASMYIFCIVQIGAYPFDKEREGYYHNHHYDEISSNTRNDHAQKYIPHIDGNPIVLSSYEDHSHFYDPHTGRTRLYHSGYYDDSRQDSNNPYSPHSDIDSFEHHIYDTHYGTPINVEATHSYGHRDGYNHMVNEYDHYRPNNHVAYGNPQGYYSQETYAPSEHSKHHIDAIPVQSHKTMNQKSIIQDAEMKRKTDYEVATKAGSYLQDKNIKEHNKQLDEYENDGTTKLKLNKDHEKVSTENIPRKYPTNKKVSTENIPRKYPITKKVSTENIPRKSPATKKVSYKTKPTPKLRLSHKPNKKQTSNMSPSQAKAESLKKKDQTSYQNFGYEDRVVVEGFKKRNSASQIFDPDYDEPLIEESLKQIPSINSDYEEPMIVDKDSSVVDLNSDYEDPVVVDDLKKGSPDKDLSSDYDAPAVVNGLVKNQPGLDSENPAIKEVLEKKTEPPMSVDLDYEEPSVSGRQKPKPSLSHDYEEPVVVEVLKNKTPPSKNSDSEYDEPAIVEALEKVTSEAPDFDYEEPVIEAILESELKTNSRKTKNGKTKASVKQYSAKDKPETVESKKKQTPYKNSDKSYEKSTVTKIKKTGSSESTDIEYEEPSVEAAAIAEGSKKKFTTVSPDFDYEEPVIEAILESELKNSKKTKKDKTKAPVKHYSAKDKLETVESTKKETPYKTLDKSYEKSTVTKIEKTGSSETTDIEYEEPSVEAAAIAEGSKKKVTSVSPDFDYEEPVIEAILESELKTNSGKPQKAKPKASKQSYNENKVKTGKSTKSNQSKTPYRGSEKSPVGKVEKNYSSETTDLEYEEPTVEAAKLTASKFSDLDYEEPMIVEGLEKVEQSNSSSDLSFDEPVIVEVLKKKDATPVKESKDSESNFKDDNQLDAFSDSGSGEPDGTTFGNDVRRLLPVDHLWPLMTDVHAQERRKFKPCTTKQKEPGHCMPLQFCSIPNLATTVDELLSSVCVIDDVFVGVCCPEFPVDTISVDWGQPEEALSDTSQDKDVNGTKECGALKGDVLEIGSWPWTVLLVSQANDKTFCGGALISEQYILTAAHCTTKIPGHRILARLQKLDSDEVSDTNLAISRIKRHALYNSFTKENDIALLKLAKPVQMGKFRQPVCLPTEEDAQAQSGLFVGLQKGSDENSVESLPIVPREVCQRSLGVIIRNSVLCTGPRMAETRCNIDSGSPLVLRSDSNQLKVIGILTWNRNDCDGRLPSVFTKVPVFTKWIEKHAV